MREQDLWQFAKRATLPFNSALTILACGVPAAPDTGQTIEPPKNNPPAQKPLEIAKFTPEGKLIGQLPLKLLGRLTSGPHPDDPADDYLTATSNSLDFAGVVPLQCHDTEKLKKWPVIPVASGKVIAVGDKNKPTDFDHSVIAIAHPIDEKQGIISLYMHMADPWVWPEQQVTTETELGTVGCNAPANWKGEPMRVSSPHLHVSFHKYLIQALGKLKREPLAAEGTILSGMVVKKDKGSGRFDGRLIRGDWTVTANEGVCGPSEATSRDCGGIFNYLTPPKPFKSGDRVKPAVNYPGDCMTVRAKPALSLEGLTDGKGSTYCFSEGREFTIQEGPVLEGEFNWWRHELGWSIDYNMDLPNNKVGK